MGSDQFTFEQNVLPVVKAWCSKALSNQSDRETKVNDAISLAWEIWLTAPSGTKPTQIAYYAFKSVQCERHLRESVRSPLSAKRHRLKPVRSEIDVALQWRDNANPAKVVGFRLDFQQWFQALNAREQRIAELLAAGHRTMDVAEQIGITPGAVSQYRRRLADSWYATR